MTFFSDYEDVLKLLKMQKKDSERNLYCAPENHYIQRGRKFVYFSTLKSQKEFKTALHWFCKEVVGVPHTMVMDGHSAQVNLDTK
jgi:hypothetical protein